jgi:hypothetical protein
LKQICACHINKSSDKNATFLESASLFAVEIEDLTNFISNAIFNSSLSKNYLGRISGLSEKRGIEIFIIVITCSSHLYSNIKTAWHSAI